MDKIMYYDMNKYINRIILAFTVVSFALVASSCGGSNRAEDTTKDPWGRLSEKSNIPQ